MLKKLHIALFYISLALLLSACGGGGGGTGNTNHAPELSTIADVSIVAGNSSTITLLATDQDNDSISFTITGGSLSTVSASISGNQITLTAASGYVTSAAIPFTVTANDGNGAMSSKTFNATVTAPTKAILKVSTANVPSDTLVGGVQAAFTLPSGTFLPTDATTGEVTNGVVALSGIANGSLSQIAYNPTTRLVNFIIANSTGFGNGEILTITVSITPDTTVQTSDFPTSASTSPYPLQIIDSASSPSIISVATCPITVTLQ